MELLCALGEHEHYRAFRRHVGCLFRGLSRRRRRRRSSIDDRLLRRRRHLRLLAAQRVRAYAAETTPVNILDWASAYRTSRCLRRRSPRSAFPSSMMCAASASHPGDAAGERAPALSASCQMARRSRSVARRRAFHDLEPRR